MFIAALFAIAKRWGQNTHTHTYPSTEEQIKKKVLSTHEKMFNITHYQRNANQNHDEVPLHASQDGCYPKVYKQ